MTPPIVNVVRSVGTLTEPFIRQRVRVSVDGVESELWYERAAELERRSSRRVCIPIMSPGSPGDRIYHLLPQIGPPLASAYREAEQVVHPALIHTHFATTGYLVGMVTRSPLVVSAYGFDVSAMARRGLWRRAYRQLADRVAAVLVEGPFMRDRVIELGFSAETVGIVRIAAQLQTVVYREPLSDEGVPMKFMACGRLVPKKGHHLALLAFAALRPVLPPGSSLEVVGDGPLAGDLHALAGRLALDESVSFPGSVSRQSFHERLARCDVFLAPSVTAPNGDSEGGAPTTILDAQATGVIVVGSTHADIPFLIDDGITGYLAREGDPEALVEAIRTALQDRPRWAAIAQAARASVVNNHSDSAVAAALRDVYTKVIASGYARA